MDFSRLDDKIRAIARRYKSSPSDIEDLEQVGRLGIWKLIERKGEQPDYVLLKRAEYDILNELKRETRKKRIPSSRLISMSTEFKGGDYTLEDLLRVESSQMTAEEHIENFISRLKDHFSKKFIKKIKQEKQPKKIANSIVRYVIEEVEKIAPEEVPRRVNYQFFVDHKLANFLWVFYKNSPYRAISDAYKMDIMPWELDKSPQRTWQGRVGYENAVRSVEWFVKKLGIKDIKDCREIKGDDFESMGLSRMLYLHFNSNPYLALKTQFPELMPWQTKQSPRGYFDDKENIKEALLSIIIDHTGFSIEELNKEEVYELGLRRFMNKHNLSSEGLRSATKHYNGSIYSMFNDLFPDKIYPWTLAGSKKAWEMDPRKTAADAVRWLFDVYLQIPVDELPNYASNKLFWRVGFSGILTNRSIGFNSSTFSAVDNAYPGVFTKEDFKPRKGVKRIEVNTSDLRKGYNWKQ